MRTNAVSVGADALRVGAAATETLLPLPPPTPPRTHIVERGFMPARFIVSRSLSQRRVPLEKDGENATKQR